MSDMNTPFNDTNNKEVYDIMGRTSNTKPLVVEVLILRNKGLTTAEIAKELKITEAQVVKCLGK